MKFSTDHIFHIGQQHLRSGMPCQDYALSESHSMSAHAIVSDGCSSGGRTEVGAKIVALAAASAMYDHAWSQSGEYARAVYEKMIAVEDTLDLDANDMLATLVVARADGIGRARVTFYGDGAAAFVYTDGSMELTRLEWRNNTPLYLAYRRDKYDGFVYAHGGEHVFACDLETHRFQPSGLQVERTGTHYQVGSALEGTTIFSESRSLSCVAVFTDGVMQVDGWKWTEVVRELLSFKSTKGDFAKRRLHGFLRKAGEVGRGPLDDIGYAVIRVIHEGSPQ